MTGMAFGSWFDGSTVDRAGLDKIVRFLAWHRDESVEAIEDKYGPGRWVVPPTVRACDGTGVAIDGPGIDWTGGWEWFGRYLPDTMPADAPSPDTQRTAEAQPWGEAAVSEFLSDLYVLDSA